MITKTEFNRASPKFDKLENRGSFYDMAVGLLNNNFEIEAYFLILATWNFARFRYAVKEFDIKEFSKKLNKLEPFFGKLVSEDFRTIDFDDYAEEVKRIYGTLSKIPGIEYTGASKMMHLKNRNVFVMWDGYIKGDKPKKYYKEIEIIKSGDWKGRKYGNDAESYLQFLKDMQETFNHINFQDDKKTFAKAIDEFNYVNITLHIQEMEKNKKKNIP